MLEIKVHRAAKLWRRGFPQILVFQAHSGFSFNLELTRHDERQTNDPHFVLETSHDNKCNCFDAYSFFYDKDNMIVWQIIVQDNAKV